MDFRLEAALEQYLQRQHLLGQVDIISIAGAAKDINDKSMGDTLCKQINLSYKLHHIQELILVNHTDCGGYGVPTSSIAMKKKSPFIETN